FLSTPYFFIIFACFPLFLGGKFFYPFFKPLGYKESVTSQLPQRLFNTTKFDSPQLARLCRYTICHSSHVVFCKQKVQRIARKNT
ncbi:hypothetical protein, partial [Heyndrickxia coagulans]|uniref:hypothetical protein n=1 Tax=Heyndrickxia coagulans TaxID=1398 RepID=UPI00214D476C